MKIKLLGTAAAEGIPALFCTCPICQHAMKKKGRNIRTRAQVLVDDDLLVDFNADTYYHKLKYHLHLEKIKTLLITHSHTDHFISFDLAYRGIYFAENINQNLNVYGNRNVIDSFQKTNYIETMDERVLNQIKFHEIQPFNQFRVDGYQINSLSANHMKNEQALLYTIQKDNKTMMICYDTARITEENYDYLLQMNLHIDCILIDGTSGKHTNGVQNVHMGLMDAYDTIQKLKDKSILKENARTIITHISHNGGYTHETYTKKAAKLKMEVAYDGMELEI